MSVGLPPAPEPRSRARLAVWYFSYFAFLGAFGTYFGLYLKSLGLSAWSISVLLSAQPVMRALAPTFWGVLADRFAMRGRLILATVAGSAVMVLLLPLAHSFATLLLLLGLLSFFWCAPLPLAEALTLAHLSHCVERYGRIRLWGSVGFIAAVQLGGVWLDFVDISWLPWICLGLIAPVLISSVGLAEAPASGHLAPEGSRLRDVLQRPAVLGLMLAAFLMAVAHGALYVFYSIHLVEHGYSKSAVGALWSLGVVAEIVVFMRIGAVMRRASIRQLLLICHAVAALRFVLIGWCIDQPWLAVFAQLMHGVTYGLMHATCVAALSRWFSHAQQSRAHALYSSVSFGFGGLAGGLLAGLLWELGGAPWVYGASAAIAASGVPFVLRLIPRK